MASKKARQAASNSLLVIVLDVSPLGWGERDLKRTAQDKARAAAGKRSVGPCILEEVLESIEAFSVSFCSIEREAGLIICGVADNESAVLYPRKDQLTQWLHHPETYVPDIRRLNDDLVSGVAELISRAARKAEGLDDLTRSGDKKDNLPKTLNTTPDGRQAAMAATFSTALCLINRFLVAARAGGVSALHDSHYLNRVDDEGVIALIGNKKRKSAERAQSAWLPRVMLIQASDDRSGDYNAFMNCTFAASKQNVVVDGCFLASGGSKTSSAFLEQACDLTGGVFLAPSGAAQIGGCLTEVLLSVFLAPLPCRPSLNLPALNKVDFRARCFETGAAVDIAYVCNQCLSIFRNKPRGHCPTCQAQLALAR